ncbi:MULTISPECIES: DUF305 domain-containing protein [Mycobacteriaceae]|uniref:DUF305 domain-containing protein n=1 Tax=Mycobacteriaceae TaxID=1762 RepID=UPI000372513D|nr:DUF305 domain-containing protein [Mycobacteroides abscessus]
MADPGWIAPASIGPPTMTEASVIHRCAAAAAVLGVASSVLGCERSAPADRGAPAPVSLPAGESHDHTDVLFAREALTLTASAVAASDIVLGKPGIDPRIRDLARRVRATQDGQPRQLQGWMLQWGFTPAAPAPVAGPGATSGQDDLRALASADPGTAGALFIQ